MAGRAARGDVMLVRFPPPDKEGPVVALTRDRSLDVLARVTVAPITSTIRGVPSEVVLDETDGMKGRCAVNLHNLVTMDRSDLGRRVARIGTEKMEQVCRALSYALGCDEGI